MRPDHRLLDPFATEVRRSPVRARWLEVKPRAPEAVSQYSKLLGSVYDSCDSEELDRKGFTCPRWI